MGKKHSAPLLDTAPSREVCPIGKARPGMHCSLPQMVTYLLRGALVHHGLSDEASRRVVITADVGDAATPALFEVRVVDRTGQDRQILRIEDEKHLNEVINKATTCGYLVADITRILES